MASVSLQTRTQEIGRELLAAARRAGTSGLFSERLMNWAMANESLRVALFRFVDVFPMLKSPQQVHAVLQEYLEGVELPTSLVLALKAGAVFKGAMAGAVGGQIESLAQRFIAGRDIGAALPVLKERWESGIGFSVDLLGEACVSDAEAAAYQRRYIELLGVLPAAVGAWPGRPGLEHDHLGAVPRANVSVKISSLCARTKPQAFEGSLEGLLKALSPILEAAARSGTFINFDMEQHALKDLTIEVFRRACETHEFPAGIALQAYLRSAEEDAQRLVAWARQTGRVITVRLIKGAYWDYETIHARLMNWPSPVWQCKAETDACFERVADLLIEAMPRRSGDGGVKLAVGSHNVRSIAHAMAALERADLPPEAIEIQMLRGMADELKAAVIQRGLRLREYVPIGEMIPGMAYLVRRLLEHTSNESWLRMGVAKAFDDELLAAPPDAASGPAMPAAVPEMFTNEPPRDFSDAAQRTMFAAAVARAGVSHVGINAIPATAADAVTQAMAAFPRWRGTALAERASVLRRAAESMHERRDDLAAVMAIESGKPWVEADADVCEAIDYCRFYAMEAERLLAPKPLGQLTGESNTLMHEPRGVAVVISPWNFPLAIPCGMTAAALVTGNPTILKPAEQSPAIGRRLCEMLWDAGVPRDVLHFVAGDGQHVGAALVADPRVALIAFTGSKAVGLGILRVAAQIAEGQTHIKKVICEMGGKNALIVDDTADLDEAVVAVARSAFSYAGQKCSACSRVIVTDAIYDAFLARLIEATRSLTLGDPRNPATDVGPLIDAAAAETVWQYIRLGTQEGRLVYPGYEVAGQGIPQLIPPHIFVDIRPEHRLANEEIFGPVLAVMRARDFGDALSIANATGYRLTGGVFSRTPSHLRRAASEFRVGNLYLNRGITGALVGRQPFGGAGLSGVGTKAGGEEYLLHFVEPRVVTENTLRRGFAPSA